MVIVSFSLPSVIISDVIQKENAEFKKNDMTGVIYFGKPVIKTITLHGNRNVTGFLSLKPTTIPINITIISENGTVVWHDIYYYNKFVAFSNSEPGGTYQVVLSSTGSQPLNFSGNINDQYTGLSSAAQFVPYMINKYPQVLVAGLLDYVKYVGIGVLGLGGALFFLDRRKIS